MLFALRISARMHTPNFPCLIHLQCQLSQLLRNERRRGPIQEAGGRRKDPGENPQMKQAPGKGLPQGQEVSMFPAVCLHVIPGTGLCPAPSLHTADLIKQKATSKSSKECLCVEVAYTQIGNDYFFSSQLSCLRGVILSQLSQTITVRVCSPPPPLIILFLHKTCLLRSGKRPPPSKQPRSLFHPLPRTYRSLALAGKSEGCLNKGRGGGGRVPCWHP